jgi:hypothetical protein
MLYPMPRWLYLGAQSGEQKLSKSNAQVKLRTLFKLRRLI